MISNLSVILSWLTGVLVISCVLIIGVYGYFAYQKSRITLPDNIIKYKDLYICTIPYEIDLEYGLPDYAVGILAGLFTINPVYVCSKDLQTLGVADSNGKVNVITTSSYNVVINSDSTMQVYILDVLHKHLQPMPITG